jgi:hypothetical protein
MGNHRKTATLLLTCLGRQITSTVVVADTKNKGKTIKKKFRNRAGNKIKGNVEYGVLGGGVLLWWVIRAIER